MANNQANSGSDLIPVTYVVTGTSTTYFWPEPTEDRNAEYFYHPVVTPTYAGWAVTGPSTTIRDITATGTATFKIVQSNVRNSGAQAYCDIIYNSVWYKIGTNIRVTLPQVIFDEINQSSTFHATVVP